MIAAKSPVLWFRLGSAAFAIVLALLALDRISEVTVATIAAILLALLLALFNTCGELSTEEKQRITSRRALVHLGIICVVARVLIASGYWVVSWIPVSRSVAIRQLAFRIYESLDFVPSPFSLVLPAAWRSGFHQYFRDSTYCFPGPLWWETTRYLRTAIPAYAVFFFPLALVLKIVQARVRAYRSAI